VDGVHLRLVHALEELAGVGGEGLDVAALAFGVDGVEGEGGFAGAAEAGDDDEFVARDFDGDVFEVVLAGAPDDDGVGLRIADLGLRIFEEENEDEDEDEDEDGGIFRGFGGWLGGFGEGGR
jgi:hypothetical protein